jgi:2-oxoglutarate ferredoxin oxidoreductase subunit gamma
VLVDAARVPTPPQGEFSLYVLPFSETAKAVGNERVANMIALGALAGLSEICSREALEKAIRTDTPAKFLELNIEALDRGYRMVAAEAEVHAAV